MLSNVEIALTFVLYMLRPTVFPKTCLCDDLLPFLSNIFMNSKRKSMHIGKTCVKKPKIQIQLFKFSLFQANKLDRRDARKQSVWDIWCNSSTMVACEAKKLYALSPLRCAVFSDYPQGTFIRNTPHSSARTLKTSGNMHLWSWPTQESLSVYTQNTT